MLRVFLCDDDSAERKQAFDYLNHQKYETAMDVKAYCSGEDLQKAFREGIRADLYLLDIVMPGIGGMELAQFIRENQPNAMIAFITSSKEFALKAYGVHAVRYLVKPIRKEELDEVLRYFLAHSQRTEDNYIITTRDGIINVDTKDIMYVENNSRTLLFTMADGKKHQSKYIRTSFEESMEDLLKREIFVQPHKSYVVNMFYIKRQNTAEMLMDDEFIVPISRKKYAEIKRLYLRFLAQR